MAFGYLNWSNTEAIHEGPSCIKTMVLENDLVNTHCIKSDFDLYYNIRNRWSTRTKEDLKRVNSILDFFKDDDIYKREAFKNVTISVLHNDKDVRDIDRFEMGQTEDLNQAQLDLLRSCDYSTNIRVTALSIKKNTVTGEAKDDSLVHYMTIAPEKEAEYDGGFNALIEYLKYSCKEKTISLV